MYKNRKAMTGLETAIILVAFVITAAAFAFVVLNMGFLTAQKAQSVISAGMSEASSSLLTDSGAIAEFTNIDGPQGDIDLVKLTFYLKLSQGHEPIDMDSSKLLGTYTNSRCHGVIYPSSTDKGQATWTTVGTTQVPSTLTVTAPSITADFSAALYDATGTTELVAAATSSGDDATADTVIITHGYAASTDYVVKITLATESGDYSIIEDGAADPAGSGGPVVVPTDVMSVTEVNGDGDTLLEFGEKFRVTIDFTNLSPEDVDPEQTADPDGIYAHPYEEFRVELRPSAGSVLSIERQIPAVYSVVMVID